MEIFTDQQRTCEDCGSAYVWAAFEQKYAFEKGYLPPKRCPPCRQLRKQQRQEALSLDSQ